MTDDQLLLDFLTRRDEQAFEALVRRYGPMVFRICRDILGDREDAQDAFQATFLVLVRQAGSIRERASLGRWLYEVAARISRRERRRASNVRAQERQALVMDVEAPPEFDPVDREMKPILHDEIRRLPSKLRDPIVLCYFEGLTVEEVARRLNCPLGTLKSRLQKGRELLRSRLTRRGLAASILLLLMFSLTEEVSAAVPEPLLESTVMVGLERGEVSQRVASLILEEEAKTSRFNLALTSSILLILVIVFGATRMASARKFQALEPNSIVPASNLDGWSFLNPFGRSRSEGLPGDHCRDR